ncbi:hypothetical protein N1851_001827 [Merluccius polli]|uniref:Uncharacterized protein n=1 Tax=Merluccius polli TaxID=89951 RepID=A0AA47NCK1_MERPO|nr:hypothetical protein N1851_001827 [Merluccius polli]
MKSDILEKVSDLIYKYKALSEKLPLLGTDQEAPPAWQSQDLGMAAMGGHRDLKPGWENLRTQLKGLGCPELAVNSLKDQRQKMSSDLNVVRANHVHILSSWRDRQDNREMERQGLVKEGEETEQREDHPRKNWPRHLPLVDKKLWKENRPRVEELQSDGQHLSEEEVEVESLSQSVKTLFQRSQRYRYNHDSWLVLDKHSSQLLQVIRKKGGAVGEKIRSILKPLDQSLVIYLGEDVSHLIKEYLVSQQIMAMH